MVDEGLPTLFKVFILHNGVEEQNELRGFNTLVDIFSQGGGLAEIRSSYKLADAEGFAANLWIVTLPMNPNIVKWFTSLRELNKDTPGPVIIVDVVHVAFVPGVEHPDDPDKTWQTPEHREAAHKFIELADLVTTEITDPEFLEYIAQSGTQPYILPDVKASDCHDHEFIENFMRAFHIAAAERYKRFKEAQDVEALEEI